jgi:hypothetical protein
MPLRKNKTNKTNKTNQTHRMTLNDYKTILKYYDIAHSSLSNDTIKNKVHTILAEKLCRCIKKVKGKNEDEGRAIGICKKSVITRKKIKIFTFNCKKTAKLNAKKGTRKLIVAKI